MHYDVLTIRPLFALALVAAPLTVVSAQEDVRKPTPAGRRLPTPVARQLPDGRIEVTWPAVEGTIKYELIRSVPPAPQTVISQPNPADTVYLDSDVKAGSTYYYVVAAIDESGQRGPRRGGVPVRASISATEGGASPGPVSSADSGAGTAGAGDTAAARDTTAPESRSAMLERAFNEGAKGFPNLKTADRQVWLALADKSGMTYDELVKSWAGIYVVHYAFEKLLERQPSGDEVKRYALNLGSGRNWHPFWREIATSPERDQKFGYYAPAPFSSPTDAQRAFGSKQPPTPEQCFGAMGDKCEGGIPQYPEVQPRWIGRFTLPDGTVMGFVDMGVAVGSILHDNACLQNHNGLNCNGIGAGDLIKTSSGPAAPEWNKAAWNLIDGRNWRAQFGPYPVNTQAHRSGWYDDLRPVASRESWMAPVLGMITIPAHTIRYTGGETKGSRRLKAPAHRTLDGKDQAFCASGQFADRFTTPLKSPAGHCR